MHWRQYAAVVVLCTQMPTSRGWANDMEDAVAAAVAAQRCPSAEPIRKDMYQPGDQVIVQLDRHIRDEWAHGKIVSIGFAGQRARNIEDEVYRIKYDGIDTGMKFEKKVPLRRLQLAPQRCDRVLIGNPKYRFLVGSNVKVVRCVLLEARLALLVLRWRARESRTATAVLLTECAKSS